VGIAGVRLIYGYGECVCYTHEGKNKSLFKSSSIRVPDSSPCSSVSIVLDLAQLEGVAKGLEVEGDTARLLGVLAWIVIWEYCRSHSALCGGVDVDCRGGGGR
jgi:hypothetical protein